MHRHHKIPKHVGGSDDESNIELLTVRQHAEAHKELFEKYGREEDRIAWLGLSGIIGREDVIRQAQRLGGKNASGDKNPWRNCKTGTNWQLNRNNQRKAQEASASAAAITKKKDTYLKIGHQQKELNSAFGTSIYRDASGNKKRFKRDQQPDGWILSKEWAENQKNKNNNTYGKKWFNNGSTNFLLSLNDERAKDLVLGRLNPGFGKQRKPN